LQIILKILKNSAGKKESVENNLTVNKMANVIR